MTRRPAGPVVTVLVAVGLLAGCSGGDDEPAPAPTTSDSPTAGTPPSLPPQGTVTLPSGVTPTPSAGTGAPVPIPTVPPD